MDRDDPRRGRIRFVPFELALGGELRQRLADLLLGLVGGAHAGVEQVHAMAMLCCDLRDPGAHRAGADDADLRVADEGGAHRPYFPVNRGGRLFRKASTPSR